MIVLERVPVRLVELDRVRGLAIVLMLVDHVAYIVGPTELRLTVGRLAMPLFFLLAGGLARRLSMRQLQAFGLGLLLPALAPWIDSPNVLVLWALGCLTLWAFDRVGAPVWLLIAAALTISANRWELGLSGYEPASMLAFMGLGRVIGKRWALSLGARLPAWLAVMGRRPLLWYVGNVLVIQGVILWLSRV